MALISLDDAKMYLRVDSADEEVLIDSLLQSAVQLSLSVARLTREQWNTINEEQDSEESNLPPTAVALYTEEELAELRPILRTAILYALGYLYEHREEADHHGLTLTLRSLLFAVREGVNF